MALTGPDCAKAVFGQVTMAFPGNNIIQEDPEPIDAALALVAANPPGRAVVAISIRVLDANGISLNCCPDGFSFDAAARTCKLGPPKPVVVNPPPPAPSPPVPPPPDPDDDELGTNFTVLFQYLLNLTQEIHNLVGSQDGGKVSADCCAAVVLVLSRMLIAVNKIEKVLKQPGAAPAPPVDLSAVIRELICICEKAGSSAAAATSIAQNLPPNLKAIADAITSAKPTDVSQIVEQLKKLFQTLDTPLSVYQQLAKDGFLDSKYLQLMGKGDSGPGWSIIPATNLHNWWHRFVHGDAGKDAYGLPDYPDSHAPVRDQLRNMFQQYIKSSDDVVVPIIRPIIDTITGQLRPTGPVSTGIINVNPETPIATALGISMTAALAAWLMSYLGIDVGEPLAHVAELIAGMVGFEEIRDVEIGPLINRGIAKVADNNAKATFRQEIPGAGVLAGLAARGLISQKQWDLLHGYSGLPGELTEATLAGAHSGLNPRLLLKLLDTGLFTDRDIADEMTFNGVRPESQHRMILAAPWLATKSERDQLKATLEKAYAQGLLTDSDFTSRVDEAEKNTSRSFLMLDRVRLERTLGIDKELESAYETEFLAGITDAAQYKSKLEGIGKQPDYITGIMAKAESHANARLVRQAAAAERALARATSAEERRAALTQFQAGTIDEARLAILLLATGLTDIQAAAWVAQALGQRAGKLRLQYGLRLSPPEATLLRQKVADLTHQRELQLLTDIQYVTALTALKIPPTFVNVLRAGANAALKPKTAAILTPVATP
jgi:hypothetical protein